MDMDTQESLPIWETPEQESRRKKLNRKNSHNYRCSDIILRDMETNTTYPLENKLVIGTGPMADVRIPGESKLAKILARRLRDDKISDKEERRRIFNGRMKSYRESLQKIKGEHMVIYRYNGKPHVINMGKTYLGGIKLPENPEPGRPLIPVYIEPECEFCGISIGSDYRLRIMPKPKVYEGLKKPVN